MTAQGDVLERLLALRGPLAKSWRPESRVFSQVVVVTLNAELAEPQISYSFPTSSDVSLLAKNAMSFCFPEERNFRRSMLERSERDTFTFTLTQSDGSRVNGYCRRFLIDGIPECYCVLSTMSSMSVFSKMLDLMEQYRRAASGPSAITRFLMAVGDAERPPPGSSIIVRVPAFDQNQRTSVTHKLVRETGNQNVLDYVSMQDLFTRLSVELVTQLVQALLLERRMILVSKDLGVLSNCVNALVALLNPFKWQHIFVPVLPRHLLDYCCAPMPFLIGIVDSFLPQVDLMPLEDVAIVYLDKGELIRPAEGLLTGPVPADHTQRLCAEVTHTLARSTGAYSRTTDLRLLLCFTNFYRELLGRYHEYFLPDQPDCFDMEAFIAGERPSLQSFLRALEEAQLWNTFVDERQSMNKRGMLKECPLLCREEEEVLKCKRCGVMLQGNVYIRRGKGICFKCYSKGNALGKLLVKKVSTGVLRGTQGRNEAKAVGARPSVGQSVAKVRDVGVRRSWSMNDHFHEATADPNAAAVAAAAAMKEESPKLRRGDPAKAFSQKLASGRLRSRDDMEIRSVRQLAASSTSEGSPRLRFRTAANLRERQAKHTSKDDMCLPSKSSIADLSDSSHHKLISSDEIISAYVALRPSARKITNAPMPHRAVVTAQAERSENGSQPVHRTPAGERSSSGWVASEPSARQRTVTADEMGKEDARRSFLAVRSRAFLAEMAERKLDTNASPRRSTVESNGSRGHRLAQTDPTALQWLGEEARRAGQIVLAAKRSDEAEEKTDSNHGVEKEEESLVKGSTKRKSPRDKKGGDLTRRERRGGKEKSRKAKKGKRERKPRKEKSREAACKDKSPVMEAIPAGKPAKQQPLKLAEKEEQRQDVSEAEVRSRAPTLRTEAVGLRPQSRQVGHMRRRGSASLSLDEATAEALLQELVASVAEKEALDDDAMTLDATAGEEEATPEMAESPKAAAVPPEGTRRVRKVRAAPQRPVCEACGVRMNRKATDVSLFANGAFWHPTCFRCRLCSCSIVPPYHIELRNNLPVHVECAAKSRKSLSSSPATAVKHMSRSEAHQSSPDAHSSP